MAPGPDRSPELGIQRFDGIRRVQNPPDIAGKGVERDDLAPGAPPALADGRVFLAPEALLEGGERGLAGIGVDGSVNALQRRGHRLAVFPGHKVEAVAQQVDDAGLHRRLREDGGDRFGETFQAVDHGDQQVFDAAVFQLVHDPQPEFGTLVLLQPKPQDFLGAVGAHAERDVDGLVAHQALVADLDPQRVKENQRIDRLQRAGLPGRDLLQHRVSDRADQVGRDVDAIELAQWPTISRVLIPRAYIEMILSSNPGNRRWY